MTLFATNYKTALMIIDVQKGFDDVSYWGKCSTTGLEENIARLLAHWRGNRWPVVHAQHLSLEPASPLRAESPGCDFKPEAQPEPGEPVYRKNVNSAFIGTGLADDLRDAGISDLVVAGLTTNHCVSTTVRMAANLGFRTLVVSDATGAFDLVGPDGARYSARRVHDLSLANLHKEFATIISTDALMSD